MMYPKTKEADFGSLKIILILGTTISNELKSEFQVNIFSIFKKRYMEPVWY